MALPPSLQFRISRDQRAKWCRPFSQEKAIQIGDRWALKQRSAILAVPRAISPDDRNVLLNPEHPDFKRIRIAPPIDYEFDPRLLGR